VDLIAMCKIAVGYVIHSTGRWGDYHFNPAGVVSIRNTQKIEFLKESDDLKRQEF
jgi:hypothetical protein